MITRKMYSLSVLLNLLLLVLFGVVCVHYHWIDKTLESIGWKAMPKTQDYLTTMSWNHTMESIDYEADVVFFGASLTSDGKWQDYFDIIKVCNLGKSGDKLESMLWRVPQITAVHPQKIFLAMEQNNMHSSSVEEIEKAYIILLDSILLSNPQAELYLESLTPLNKIQFQRVCDNRKISEVNKMIERIANKRGLVFINLYNLFEKDGQLPMSISTDGQHLKPEAYHRWADALRQYIEK